MPQVISINTQAEINFVPNRFDLILKVN
uniref:Uncharacterized protein n=1 Tax=Lepeophtheirus salmonis TaxID=72036 RepID=A0A0K2V3N5_LEPSM